MSNFTDWFRAKGIGHLAVLACMFIFGFNTVIAKNVMGPDGVAPRTVIFCRFIGAVIAFWIISLIVSGRKREVSLSDMPVLMGAGLLGAFINQYLFTTGLSYASPLDISLIIATGPIMTLVLAALILKEPITFIKAVGVACGALGAGWLSLLSGAHTPASALRSDRLLGIVLCLASSLSYALYLTLFKRIIDKYSPLTLMRWVFTYAALFSIPFCLPDFLKSDIWHKSSSFYWSLGYVVLGATFLAYLLMPIAQKRIRPTVFSMYMYLQPIITGTYSILIGLDTWYWNRIPAVLFIFFGVFLVTQSKSRAEMIGEMRHRVKDSK